MSAESQYIDWLKEQLSPTKLSDYYIVYHDIDQFCQEYSLLSQPLLETTDLLSLSTVKAAIEANASYRGMTKKQVSNMLSALRLYASYVKRERPVRETAAKLPEEKKTISKTGKTSGNAENEDELIRLIRSRNIPFADHRKKGAFLWLIGGHELDSFVREVSKLGVDFRYSSSGAGVTGWKPGWRTTSTISVQPKKTYSSARKSKAEPEVPQPPDKTTSGVNGPRFTDWLITKGYKIATVYNYLSTLKQMSSFAARTVSFAGEVLSENDPERIRTLIQTLENSPEYKTWCSSRHNAPSATLAQYLAFCEEVFTKSAKSPAPDEAPLIKSTPEPEREEAPDKPLADASHTPQAAEALSPELEAFLEGDGMKILREKLAEEHILTLEQLLSINLWTFMNRNSLYSIAARNAVCSLLTKRLREYQLPPAEQVFTIKTQSASYSGRSPSDAFVSYCEAMANKYPLKFRKAIGLPIKKPGGLVLYRNDFEGDKIKLANPVCYVSSSLSAEEALDYSRWLRLRCNDPDEPLTLEETKKQVTATSAEPRSVQVEPDPAEQSKVAEQTSRALNVSKKQIKDAEDLVLATDMDGISYYELSDKMFQSLQLTKRIVAASEKIVELPDRRLVHQDAFVDWEDAADNLEAILEKLLDKNNGYVSSSQLYDYVRAGMYLFLNDNAIDDERIVFAIVQHLFEKVGYHGKRYAFHEKTHISRRNASTVRSKLELMQKFARDCGGYFQYDDLVDYLEKVGVKTNSLRQQMRLNAEPIIFSYNENSFITAESMKIDPQWCETAAQALRALFADVGNHVILRDVPELWLSRLPALPAGRPWTLLLLQSVLIFYSKQLGARTIAAAEGQNYYTLHAMLVSADSEIETFCDAVYTWMTDEEISRRRFSAEALQKILADNGMIGKNELRYTLPKALAKDPRFSWDASGQFVTIRS